MIKIVSLDNKFLDNMKYILGNEYDDYINSFNNTFHRGLRANTLKISKEDLKKILCDEFESINWCDDGMYFKSTFRPAKSYYYNAGLFYIQEPSAMAPVEILNVEKGDFVLDMCGAPGGKSTQISSKLKGSGLLISNDYSVSRAKVMAKNLELMGASNYIVLAEEQSKLRNRFINFFDKILVDAPCSGEGMFRKDFDLIKNWSEDTVVKYSQLQENLLNNAKDMLKKDGIIVYSTCTLNLEENEKVIENFLKTNKEFSLLEIDVEKSNISKGFGSLTSTELNKTARILPHKHRGEGHFIAKLKKNIGDVSNCNTSYKVDKIKNIEFFYDFIKEYLLFDILSDEYELKLHGTSLFKVHKSIYDMSKIRVVRSGFYLGELKKNRFEPSQSLALFLKSSQFKTVLKLNYNDIRVEKYLKGETIECGDEKDWVLICLENYPLGFGKANNGKIKNKYDVKFINL